MDRERNAAKPHDGRRTAGEGVPRRHRKGAEKAEDIAEPERGREEGSARLSRKPTARDREGL
jgi:hypothetical protein